MCLLGQKTRRTKLWDTFIFRFDRDTFPAQWRAGCGKVKIKGINGQYKITYVRNKPLYKMCIK